MTILPPHLDVPLETAARLVFDGDALTARDVSYAIAAAWLAARSPDDKRDDDHYRIPDNRVRQALGRTRRSTIDVEIARFDRLRHSVMGIDELLPMPTAMYRKDSVIRATLDDEMTWVIDRRVVDLFSPGKPSIALPLRLLAVARYRSTLDIVMRMLAQHAMGATFRNTYSWAPDRIAVRLTFEELGRFLGVDASRPSVVIQRYLEPVANDAFEACGITFQFEARRTATIRNPNGKYRDVLMLLVMPSPTPLEDAIRAQHAHEASGWTKATPAKKRGRPRKVAAPMRGVADATNVTVLRSAFGMPSKLHRMPSIGSVISEGIRVNDDGSIDF
ncbi:hypothetical protein [Devosia sp. MC521]|uniref:hypothetical protein n=1 Tax=Devosia sp. MC521 TaxID=2759954 RepID=UPI0015F8D84A|nr:hypothetical protein [Devosia sp. MC521]MBJ6986053.1 hypothetical protein [Devosia sp. MC521]QMW61423.1 hypothetical protein H4N61_10555 [Devosia sp. MC521]